MMKTKHSQIPESDYKPPANGSAVLAAPDSPGLRLLRRLEKGLIEVRKCSICGGALGYHYHSTMAMVVFNSACDCSGDSDETVRPAEWQELFRAFQSEIST